ncbi:MAG: HD domain-containing protein [Candidatus Omnitrophica bacterium]|nr:HD domain-containing protein [Candidatus Omnitrophota bacterium]
MQNESGHNEQVYQKVWVSDLKAGDKIQSVFQITRINLRDYDKGKFLALRLGDKTGKISAVLWSLAEEIFQVVSEGDLVIVEGRVSTYQQELQVKIYTIRKVADLSQYDLSDFLPVSPTPLEQLVEEFDAMIESVKDDDYKKLLQSFRNDESLWPRFSLAPGAKRWHHPYLHGLLDHTLCVTKMCRQMAAFYPEIDSDLLITGAVFHDCGKLDEYVYKTQIDFSTEGRLLGHLFQGSFIVERLVDGIPGFPREKRMLLLHIIASHHGEVVRSPVLPMTMEACLLHHVENMDAQMAAIRREMNAARKQNQTWTGYVKLMERALYLGENGNPSDNGDNENYDDSRL